MDELIFKSATIDALWKALYEYEDKTEKQFQESEELDVADWFQHRIFVQNMSDIDRQTILNLPSAQPEPRWIPVEYRPPEFGKDVLISHKGVVSIDWLTQSEGSAFFFMSGAGIADIDA